MASLISVDDSAEPFYDSDQANVNYPVRFPTVELCLVATDGLVVEADRIREKRGFAPTSCERYRSGDRSCRDCESSVCDVDCWYNFYVSLNGYTKSHVDNSISFSVVNTDSEDNEEQYLIYLTEEEQRILYQRLDEQCRESFGLGCEELLAEAEREMCDGG